MTEPSSTGVTPLHRRLVHVLFDPGRVFEELRDQPLWLGPLVVALVVSVTTMVAVPPEVFAETIRRSLMEAGADVPANLDFAMGISRLVTPVAAGLGLTLWALVLTSVVFLVFAFVLGDDGRFRQYWCVTCHALLVLALGAVVTLPLKISQMDLQLTLSLGTFALFMDEGYWLSFLNLMDLFGIWALMLVALGASKIDKARSWGSASAVVLGIWAVVALVLAPIIP